MEARNPIRRPTLAEWEEFWETRRLVFKQRKLRGEPKLLWQVLWWDVELWRGGAADVTAAQLAHAIGAADAKSGRTALSHLKNFGLVQVHYEDKASGFKTISMPDPRDVLKARRHGSHGQGELFDPEADELQDDFPTDPECPPAVFRPLGRVARAEGPDLPPEHPKISRTAHPREDAPAHVQALAPSPNLENLDPTTVGNFNFAHRSSIAQKPSVLSETGGASAGGCAAVGRANPFATAFLRLAGPDAGDNEATIANRVSWLRQQVPGVWYEIARWVVEEVMELRGPTKFTVGELSKIVAKTRGKQERGELTRPAAVYFAGACEMRFRQFGRPWPKFVAARPGNARGSRA